VTEPTFNRFSC